MIEIKHHPRQESIHVEVFVTEKPKTNRYDIDKLVEKNAENGFAHIYKEDAGMEGFIPWDSCNVCGGNNIEYFKGIDKTGYLLFKSYCLACGRFRSVRQEKNAKKHKNNGGWRWKALQRTGGKCQICGSTENINVHHIIPVCVAPQYFDNDGNAAVVCKRCHDMIHRCDDWSRK